MTFCIVLEWRPEALTPVQKYAGGWGVPVRAMRVDLLKALSDAMLFQVMIKLSWSEFLELICLLRYVSPNVNA